MVGRALGRDGRLPEVENHELSSRGAGYRRGDVEVPVTIRVPHGGSGFPVMVFLYGQRGMGQVTKLVPSRLAARAFTVVALDLYTGRFIDP